MRKKSKAFVVSISLLLMAVIPATAAAISIVPEKCQSEQGCGICDIALAVVSFSNIVAGGLSGMALLFFIIGGFYLILSGGNEQRIESGKKILVGTVTGVAIVFLAWFAVNFVIRVAYQGSNDSTGDPVVTVFGVKTSWWSLPACDPTNSGCGGKYVGEVCGGVGECVGGGIGCTCYRSADPKGDNLTCSSEGDAGSLSAAAGGTKKQCYCASPCTQQKYASFKQNGDKFLEYTCIDEKNVYEKSKSKYTLQSKFSCTKTTDVCVTPK